MASVIKVTVGGNFTYRARLLEQDNPETVSLIKANLPIRSFLLHPNVSGQGMVIPTTVVFMGKGHMRERKPGSMYLYAPGQSIVCTYGETNEIAPVNVFAEVLDGDLPILKQAGELVYQKTLAGSPFEEVTVEVSLDKHVVFETAPEPPAGDDWSATIKVFEWYAEQLNNRTPDEIIKVFNGVIDSGMGTGSQSFTVMMHIWSYLMTDGPNVLYRFLADTKDLEMTPGLLVRQTKRHLLEPFSHPEFLSNLGLAQFTQLGTKYKLALDSIDIFDRKAGIDQYCRLTGAFMTVINLLHRRVQQHFPFHLGKAFPHRNAEQFYEITAILLREVQEGKRELPEDFPRETYKSFAAHLAKTAQ